MSVDTRLIRTYYAHSAENRPEQDWQTLPSHLANVGDTAARFAAFFGVQEMARYTGCLHDLGKYSPEFDRRLRSQALETIRGRLKNGEPCRCLRHADPIGGLLAACASFSLIPYKSLKTPCKP